jgi:hypothetical protein
VNKWLHRARENLNLSRSPPLKAGDSTQIPGPRVNECYRDSSMASRDVRPSATSDAAPEDHDVHVGAVPEAAASLARKIAAAAHDHFVTSS